MSFDVYKYLRPGFIRFRVDPHSGEPQAGASTEFSTGPRGEFRGRRRTGMVFDEAATSSAVGGGIGHIRVEEPRTAFRKWFQTGETVTSAWVTLGLTIAGAILILLGVLVLTLTENDTAGWIEIILGAALVAGPHLLAAKRRRDERVRLERERAEREEQLRAVREQVGEMSRLLDSITALPDEAELPRIAEERKKFDVSYEAMAPMARQAAMRAGFDGVARADTLGEREVGRRIDQLCSAVGLTHEDTRAVKQRICRRLGWHLIADERMTPEMQARLRTLAEAMGLNAADFGAEWNVADEFRRMSAISFGSLPRKTAPIELRYGEYVHHRSGGTCMKPSGIRPSVDSEVKLAEESWLEDCRCELWVTTKGIRLTGERNLDFDYNELRGIEIDADRGVLVLTYSERKTVALELSDPYYTATMIDFASEADRPKIFGLGSLDRRPTV